MPEEDVQQPQPIAHVPQLFSWDCGLACVLMVLRGLGCSCDYQQLRKLSQTTSVWTVDLAHLLARFGAAVTFSTLTIGINDSFANEAFYMESLEGDQARVQQLFTQAAQLGISLQQRSIPLHELAAAVGSGQQLAILLVDKRKLDPWAAAADVAWNLTTGVTSATGYTGHYILLVGYEPAGSTAAAAAAPAAPGSSSAAVGEQAAAGAAAAAGSDQQQQPELAAAAGQQQHQHQHQQQWLWWQRQDPGAAVAAGTPPAGAAAAAGQGCFWVHDPAKPRGPKRVPAAVVEAARKSFGTDEDVLLVRVAAGVRGQPPCAAAVAGGGGGGGSSSNNSGSTSSGDSGSSATSSSCHCRCEGGGGGHRGGSVGCAGSEQQQQQEEGWRQTRQQQG